MTGHLIHVNSKGVIQISVVATDKISSESLQVEQQLLRSL